MNELEVKEFDADSTPEQDERDARIEALEREWLTAEEHLACEVYLASSYNAFRAIHAIAPTEPHPLKRWHMLTAKKYVREYLTLRRKQILENTVTAEDILLRVKDIVDKCSEPVELFDKKGEPTGLATFDSVGALKGLDMLYKMHKGLTEEPPPSVHIHNNTQVNNKMELTPEMLNEAVESLKSKLV